MITRDTVYQWAACRRGIRHAKGISQEELAHEANVNRTYMSKIERGGTWVGLEIIDTLASALEVERGISEAAANETPPKMTPDFARRATIKRSIGATDG